MNIDFDLKCTTGGFALEYPVNECLRQVIGGGGPQAITGPQGPPSGDTGPTGPSNIPTRTEGGPNVFDGIGTGDLPIVGDGTPGDKIRIRSDPMFVGCGEVIQYRPTTFAGPFGASGWHIVQGGGQINVTVGPNITTAPNRALFPLVDSAFTAGCIHVRVIQNTIDGNISVPNGAVVYIDPGVTWTVGTLTLGGSFTLLGNMELVSTTNASIIQFTGGAPAQVSGTGSFVVCGIRWIGQLFGAFVDGVVPMRIEHCRLDIPNTTNSGIGLGPTFPLVNCRMSHVEFNRGIGGFATNIIVGDSTSVATLEDIFISDSIGAAIPPVTPMIDIRSKNLTINGIRSRRSLSLWVGGNISDVVSGDFSALAFGQLYIDNCADANFQNLKSTRISIGTDGINSIRHCTFNNVNAHRLPAFPLITVGRLHIGSSANTNLCSENVFNNFILATGIGDISAPNLLTCDINSVNCEFNNFLLNFNRPVIPPPVAGPTTLNFRGNNNTYDKFKFLGTINVTVLAAGNDCIAKDWSTSSTQNVFRFTGDRAAVANPKVAVTGTNFRLDSRNGNLLGGIIGTTAGGTGNVTSTITFLLPPDLRPSITGVKVEAPAGPAVANFKPLTPNVSWNTIG